MNIKIFIAGVAVGGVLAGAATWVITDKEAEAKLFANKERCATYAAKRYAEYNENSSLSGTHVDVQGFYSPVANTCITNTQEIGSGHYILRRLTDELTGEGLAYSFEATGQDLAKLSQEEMKMQVEQDKLFGERLRYFQGY